MGDSEANKGADEAAFHDETHALRTKLPSYGTAETGAFGESPPAESPSLARRTPSIRNLPDLTHRLIEAGIYGEYADYRRKYQQWRKGQARGAAGELTASALQLSSETKQFEFWYPTASIFQWRYTMSYWKAIMFLLGSLLFTFDSAVSYFLPPGQGVLVRTVPNAIGSTLFSIATYIGYLHLINIATPKSESISYFIPDCKGMLEKDAQASSVIGTCAFFIGAVLFNVGIVGEVFEESMSPAVRFTLVSLANVIASSLFVLGGFCECWHNRIFCGGATMSDLVWWAAVMDTIGGFCFLSACLPPLIEPDRTVDHREWVQMNYLIGSALFVLSSAMLLFMWRANNFGMTLLRQLNLAVRAKGFVNLAVTSTDQEQHIGVRLPISDEAGEQDSNDPPFHSESTSMRDTFYIIFYSWFMFVAIANTLFRQQRYSHRNMQDWHWMDMMMDMCMQVFIVFIISLVLVAHSVVAEVPHEQPYLCIVVCLRWLLIAGAMVQTFWFVKFWVTPSYKVVSVT